MIPMDSETISVCLTLLLFYVVVPASIGGAIADCVLDEILPYAAIYGAAIGMGMGLYMLAQQPNRHPPETVVSSPSGPATS
jgi:hypothetical protein